MDPELTEAEVEALEKLNIQVQNIIESMRIQAAYQAEQSDLMKNMMRDMLQDVRALKQHPDYAVESKTPPEIPQVRSIIVRPDSVTENVAPVEEYCYNSANENSSSDQHQYVSPSTKPDLIFEDTTKIVAGVNDEDLDGIDFDLDSDLVFSKPTAIGIVHTEIISIDSSSSLVLQKHESKNENVESGVGTSVCALNDSLNVCPASARQNAYEMLIYSLPTGKPPPLPPEVARSLVICHGDPTQGENTMTSMRNFLKTVDMAAELRDLVHSGIVPKHKVDFDDKSEFEMFQNSEDLQGILNKLRITKRNEGSSESELESKADGFHLSPVKAEGSNEDDQVSHDFVLFSDSVLARAMTTPRPVTSYSIFDESYMCGKLPTKVFLVDKHTVSVPKTDEYDDLNEEIRFETLLCDLISSFSFCISTACENDVVDSKAYEVLFLSLPPPKPPDDSRFVLQLLNSHAIVTDDVIICLALGEVTAAWKMLQWLASLENVHHSMPTVELDKRKAQGLCFHWGEKWPKGHKCEHQFNTLIVPEEQSDEAMVIEDNGRRDVELSTPTQFHSLSDRPISCSIRIVGICKGIQVEVMWDSGSNINFIHAKAAKKLQMVQRSCTPFDVQAGGGELLHCVSVCEAVAIEIQGHLFVIDFYVIESMVFVLFWWLLKASAEIILKGTFGTYKFVLEAETTMEKLPTLHSEDGSGSLGDHSKPIHVFEISLDRLKDLVIPAFEIAILCFGFSLGGYFLMRFVNKIFMFSVPRPPEITDLEDKVNFKDGGMLRNRILKNLGELFVFWYNLDMYKTKL